MSDQLVSWLTDSSEVLSLIADNLHHLRRIVWELSGIIGAVGGLVCAWQLLLCRCRREKHGRRTKG
jgi:hypothetical protein